MRYVFGVVFSWQNAVCNWQIVVGNLQNKIHELENVFLKREAFTSLPSEDLEGFLSNFLEHQQHTIFQHQFPAVCSIAAASSIILYRLTLRQLLLPIGATLSIGNSIWLLLCNRLKRTFQEDSK